MTDRFTCPCCGNEFRLTAEKITPPEPEQQEIKLYCVKDYEPGEWLTEGNVYTVVDGRMTFDDGYRSTYDDRPIGFGDLPLPAHFAPLVQRPAKVGEWVYVTEDYTGKHGRPNNIYKVIYDAGDNDVVFRWDGTGCVPQQNYLVLDGYKGDAT